MGTSTARIIPRPTDGDAAAEVERRLGTVEVLWENAVVRKTAIILLLALVWEVYGRLLDNSLLFPTLSETLVSLAEHVRSGVLPARAWASVKVLLMGYGAGVALAGVLTVLAINTRLGSDFLETVTGMLSPLPAIALLPLALIWFGLGNGSLVFILVGLQLNIILEGLGRYSTGFLALSAGTLSLTLVLARLAYGSVAKTAILPVQDLLGLDEHSRMNMPGQGTNNWAWRLRPGQLNEGAEDLLKKWTGLYNRE